MRPRVADGRTAALRCVLVADRVGAPLAMLDRLARHAGIRLVAVLPDHALAIAEAAMLRPDIVFLTPRADAERWTTAFGAAGREAPTVVILTDADAAPAPRDAELARPPRAPHAPATEAAAVRGQLTVRDRGGLFVLRDEEIDWLRAEDRHVAVSCGAVLRLVRRSLNAFERALDPHRFVRVHRDFIVRLDRVREIHPMFHGDQELVLHDGTRLPLSRRYVRRFLGLTQFAEAAR